jgi:hypothetical protein
MQILSEVSDHIKSLSSFNMRKEGVQVEVKEWIGDLDHFNELSEIWIHLEGIPPKWCDWRVFTQMALGFGLLLEVDRASLFKSFYEKVRIKIACRSPTKIPAERLFEMDKKLYMVTIMVEGVQDKGDVGPSGGHDDDDQDDQDKEGKDDDEYDDLDNIQDTMETDKKGSHDKNPIQSKRWASACGEQVSSSDSAVTY